MRKTSSAYNASVRDYTKAAQQGYAVGMEPLRILANEGNAEAQFNLGVMYENGSGVSKNAAEALAWFLKVAEQGHAVAQYRVGVIYNNHFCYKDAFKCFTEAAEQGHTTAQHNLGVMYENGFGVSQSDQKALEWYRKSAEQGYAEAQFDLGVIAVRYANKESCDAKKNQYYLIAAHWYVQSAKQRHTLAQHNLGVMYENGFGVSKNYQQAFKWYGESAKQGYAKAQYNLGVMYANGFGVSKSDQQAFECFTEAAEQGYAKAQYNLGVMYENGFGVSKSDQKAFEWYRKSAEQGYRNAQNNLGVMYRNGFGVSKSDQKAFEWYRKSAEQGYAKAQYNLGVMYANGWGVEKSDQEAFEWHGKSAEQGHVEAQIYLAKMYYHGWGVKKSVGGAATWYGEAAKQGSNDAWHQLVLMVRDGVKEAHKPLAVAGKIAAEKRINKLGDGDCSLDLSSLYLTDERLACLMSQYKSKFINLSELNLSNNLLEGRLDVISHSDKLKVLNLTGNQFTSLPGDFIDGFPVLEKLKLVDNPLKQEMMRCILCLDWKRSNLKVTYSEEAFARYIGWEDVFDECCPGDDPKKIEMKKLVKSNKALQNFLIKARLSYFYLLKPKIMNDAISYLFLEKAKPDMDNSYILQMIACDKFCATACTDVLINIYAEKLKDTQGSRGLLDKLELIKFSKKSMKSLGAGVEAMEVLHALVNEVFETGFGSKKDDENTQIDDSFIKRHGLAVPSFTEYWVGNTIVAMEKRTEFFKLICMTDDKGDLIEQNDLYQIDEDKYFLMARPEYYQWAKDNLYQKVIELLEEGGVDLSDERTLSSFGFCGKCFDCIVAMSKRSGVSINDSEKNNGDLARSYLGQVSDQIKSHTETTDQIKSHTGTTDLGRCQSSLSVLSLQQGGSGSESVPLLSVESTSPSPMM